MTEAISTDDGTVFEIDLSTSAAETVIPKGSNYSAVVLYNESDRRAHFRVNPGAGGTSATLMDRFLPPGASMTYYIGGGLVINALTDAAPAAGSRLLGFPVQTLRSGGWR